MTLDKEKITNGIRCCIRSNRELFCPEDCPYADADEEKDRCDTQVLLAALDLIDDEPVKWSWAKGGGLPKAKCSGCGFVLTTPVFSIDMPIKFCPGCGKRVEWDAE